MIKKLSFLIVLLFVNCSVYCADITITVTNNLAQPLYISAKNIIDETNEITILPETLFPGAQNISVQFKNTQPRDRFFEIYFGRFVGDENCTLAYNFETGLETAECSDLNYKIESNGKSIIINGER